MVLCEYMEKACFLVRWDPSNSFSLLEMPYTWNGRKGLCNWSNPIKIIFISFPSDDSLIRCSCLSINGHEEVWIGILYFMRFFRNFFCTQFIELRMDPEVPPSLVDKVNVVAENPLTRFVLKDYPLSVFGQLRVNAIPSSFLFFLFFFFFPFLFASALYVYSCVPWLHPISFKCSLINGGLFVYQNRRKKKRPIQCLDILSLQCCTLVIRIIEPWLICMERVVICYFHLEKCKTWELSFASLPVHKWCTVGAFLPHVESCI